MTDKPLGVEIKIPPAVTDLLLIGILSLVVYAISWRFDLFEYIAAVASAHEQGELDEILTVVFFLALAFVIFAYRRWKELEQERAEILRARDALRESSDRFRSLVETSPNIIWEIDEQGKFRYISPVYLQIMGFTPEEIIGKSIADMVTDESVPATREAFIRYSALEEGFPPFEIPVRHRNGQQRILEIRPSKMKDRDGKTIGFRGVAIDITERKRTEEALRESEEKFRSIVETSPNMIWEVDILGKFRYMSPAVSAIMGYAPEEIIGKSVTELVPDDHRDFALEKLGRMVSKDGSLFPVEVPARHRDGRDLVLEIRPARLTGTDRTLKGLRGVAIDITDRKRAEEALRKSREDLAEAMDIANLVNWEYDVATRMFTFDDRFYALYGTSREREGGTLMSAETYAREFVHPDDSGIVARETEKAIRATDPGYLSQVEHRIVRRDGIVRHIVVRIRITKDAEGRTVRTHGANQDITERKNAEEAFRRANRQLSLLAGITRHDIINKITVILGYLHIVQARYPDPQLAEYLQKIEANTEVIREQIEFTRMYENLGTSEPRWMSLTSALAFSQVPSEIALSVDVGDVQVYADPMLPKVFFNLLDNSIRHGERVTRIRVFTRPSGRDLVVVWEDNGIGVPAEQKEQIFERGFGKHTGLGMFLVKEILSLTGIAVTETGEAGNGARFEILVPEGKFRILA